MVSGSIVVLGAGGHARACVDVVEREGRFRIAALVGLAEEVGSFVLGYPVRAESDLEELRRAAESALVAVGQIRSASARVRLFEMAERGGFKFPPVISPFAYVSPHASIGEGTIVMHGAVINAGARVGRNCIVNSRSLVEHDVTIGDHCHLSTGAVLNGGVRTGERTFIGSGAVVREGVTIGADCVVGMGERVFEDAPAGAAIRQQR